MVIWRVGITNAGMICWLGVLKHAGLLQLMVFGLLAQSGMLTIQSFGLEKKMTWRILYYAGESKRK
jgi:hypothetical protein